MKNNPQSSDATPRDIELVSILTCPACGHSSTEAMPTNACIWFHECASCHRLLRPLPGDCCVFCSYGSVKCPPVQAAGAAACCGSGSAPHAR